LPTSRHVEMRTLSNRTFCGYPERQEFDLGKGLMKIRSLFLFTAMCFSSQNFTAVAASQTLKEPHKDMCLSQVDPSVNNALGEKISEHYRAFERLEGTYGTVEGQLSAIQSVLAETQFSWVLDCPSRVRERGYEFSHNFKPRGGWSFIAKPSTRTAQLSMRLNNRFWPATATYLHEMIHACQFADDRRTQIREGVRTAASSKLAVRLRLIGEVEAFKAMHDLFAEVNKETPLACEFRNNLNRPVWSQNRKTKSRLENGTFAGGIIGWYVHNWPHYSYADFANVSDFEQGAVQHVFREEWVGWREFRPLKQDMVDEILALGLKHDANEIPFLPDPFVSNLPTHFQRVLQMAKCYKGPMNDRWDERGSKALEAFVFAANMDVETSELSLPLLRSVWNSFKADKVTCK